KQRSSSEEESSTSSSEGEDDLPSEDKTYIEDQKLDEDEEIAAGIHMNQMLDDEASNAGQSDDEAPLELPKKKKKKSNKSKQSATRASKERRTEPPKQKKAKSGGGKPESDAAASSMAQAILLPNVDNSIKASQEPDKLEQEGKPEEKKKPKAIHIHCKSSSCDYDIKDGLIWLLVFCLVLTFIGFGFGSIR